MSDEEVRVRDHAGETRYEITVDGALAGFTVYRLHGTEADFVHTEIAPEFGGRGLATRLIRDALDDARRRGWQVLPYCPFVRAFVQRHPEYADLVPAVRHGRFGLPT